MNKHRIAIIAGDGIGKEVIPAGLSVLRAAADVCGFEIETEELNWSCDYYLQTGRIMDDDGLRRLQDFSAIYLGAVGDPARVPDHISLRELLIKTRDERVGTRIGIGAGSHSRSRRKQFDGGDGE